MFTNYFSTPYHFADRAEARGYKWVTYQWNDGNYGAYNRSQAPAVKDACLSRGIWYTIWLTRPFNAADVRAAVIESQCNGVILEGEIPGDRPEAVNWAEVVFMLQDIDIPKAIVTNFAPFVSSSGQLMPEKALPLINDGWACITENFISESPNSTPANTDFFAKHALGWAETQPMVELWRLAEYGDLSRYRNVSHWDAGNMATSGLRQLLSLVNGTPQKPLNQQKREAAQMFEKIWSQWEGSHVM